MHFHLVGSSLFFYIILNIALFCAKLFHSNPTGHSAVRYSVLWVQGQDNKGGGDRTPRGLRPHAARVEKVIWRIHSVCELEWIQPEQVIYKSHTTFSVWEQGISQAYDATCYCLGAGRECGETCPGCCYPSQALCVYCTYMSVCRRCLLRFCTKRNPWF